MIDPASNWFRPSIGPFTPGTDGIWADLSARAYFDAPGVSQSTLKLMDPTPAHLAGKPPDQPTPEKILGTLVHRRRLEPAKPQGILVVPPEQYPAPADSSLVKSKKVAAGDLIDWSWQANYCKAWRQAHEAEGHFVLTEKEFTAYEGMVASLYRHPECQKIFTGGHSELSAFCRFTYGYTVLRKARFDYVPHPSSCALVDIKTAEDASPAGFAKAMLDYGYYRQFPYYLDLWNDLFPNDRRRAFVCVVVEKKPPYLVAIYHISNNAIGKGRAENIDALALYATCQQTGIWPGYPETIQTIDLPKWAYKNAA